jgi:RES domain-containing protein
MGEQLPEEGWFEAGGHVFVVVPPGMAEQLNAVVVDDEVQQVRGQVG